MLWFYLFCVFMLNFCAVGAINMYVGFHISSCLSN